MATNNGLDIKFYDDSVYAGVVGLEVKVTSGTATVAVTLPSGNTYTTPNIGTLYAGLLNIPEITTSMAVGTYVFTVTDNDGDTSSTTFYYSSPTLSSVPTLSFSYDLDCVNSELSVTENTDWDMTYDGTTMSPYFHSPLELSVDHTSQDSFNCSTATILEAGTGTLFPVCQGAYNVSLETWVAEYNLSIAVSSGTITTATDIMLRIAPTLNINQISVDCNNKICGLECCLKSLYEKYKDVRLESKELELEYYNKTMYALQIARLAKRALLCGKITDFDTYVLEMGEIMECQDCLDC